MIIIFYNGRNNICLIFDAKGMQQIYLSAGNAIRRMKIRIIIKRKLSKIFL